MVLAAKSIEAGPIAFAGPKFREINHENFKLVLVRSYVAELSMQDLKNLRDFRRDLENTPNNVITLGGGENGVVYAVNARLAVKEILSGKPALEALEHMVWLYRFLNDKAPEFIRVPAHYGALLLPDSSRQFLLMQRVPRLNAEKLFDEAMDDDDKYILSRQVARGLDVLYDWFGARVRRGELSEEFLLDLANRNVLIDTTRPTRFFPFTLWVVDQ